MERWKAATEFDAAISVPMNPRTAPATVPPSGFRECSASVRAPGSTGGKSTLTRSTIPRSTDSSSPSRLMIETSEISSGAIDSSRKNVMDAAWSHTWM